MSIRSLFIYVPFVFFALSFFSFVRRCGFGVRAQAVWSMVLLACFSKFFMYNALGGDSFTPWLPERLIWTWNWAYSGACILLLLSLLSLPLKRRRLKAFVLPLAAWCLAAVGVWSGVKLPEVREVELAFADLPAELDGYRIAHVSDLHVSSAARRWRTEGIVARVNAARPDLICLTGDFMDGDPATHAKFIEPLKDLRARDGVYAVSGNHEFFYDFFGWLPYYREWGLKLLRNECVFPRPCLALGGVDDSIGPLKYPGLVDEPDSAKAFAAATNGEFRILMEHKPKFVTTNLCECAFRLQLSGHTHGGVMPGMAQLVRLANFGFVRGVYCFPGGAKLFVTTGAGQWAGFPVRFFDPSEIAIITLRRRNML